MDRGEICDRFLDSVSFELYPFQEEALLAWFEVDGGLLVSAPTGMGKTLIAEAALFEALHTGRRLYYTTPLIALTEQKFREFQDKAEDWGFDRRDVGFITGNRKENPDARICVVVAEILLNHLLEEQQRLHDVGAVVMDEFHYFNEPERGIVWELSLVLLPPHIRLMLLSATVGNSVEFVHWLRKEHGRKVQVVQTDERRVPLEFEWVGDKLLTEHLPQMVEGDDAQRRSPALVFCFNRDECWEVAERIKGVKLIDQATRAQIEEHLDAEMFSQGAGPKLRQMLIRGVAVHHAGILPKYKEKVETLFLKKLIPIVVCTETLAAGINLPARSVVLSTLVKGKRGDKKLVLPSAAHQMFGRAGRPQFDSKGYVYALAHADDVKIVKWRRKYDQIDPKSKDPGLMRARKQLERKKPSRRKTEQYWSEGQFKTLIEAGPAKLLSRGMIPYQVLIYLLTRTGSLHTAREFLSKRFNTPERLKKFQDQLDHMVGNLASFGYVTRNEDGAIVLSEDIRDLLLFRSVDPLYGAFLCKQLVKGNFEEKLLALESVLSMPPAIERKMGLPDHLEPGPLQIEVLEPKLLGMGLVLSHPDGGVMAVDDVTQPEYWEEKETRPRLSLPEMLKTLFDATLETPEEMFIQPKWVAGGIIESSGDFFKFVRARDLVKNEGLALRHLLRLVILAGEFATRSDGDPDYARIGELVTRICEQVDPRYTDRFLAAEQESRKLLEG
ncbi:MAG: DEAD/DEAH box helicase [Planctomycetes bacterium]|nr:DEAD/DEAH box helicase [Planctomycetota bacterium]